jgi:hypothetical protein
MKKIFIGALSFFIMPCLSAQSISMVANDTIFRQVCGETIYDDGGASGLYSQNSKSAITLAPNTKGKHLKLTIEKIDIDHRHSLHIYSGSKIDSTKEIGNYSSLRGSTACFYADTVTLILTSGWGSGAGFAMKTECIDELPVYDFKVTPLTSRPLIVGPQVFTYQLATSPEGTKGISDLCVHYYLSKDTVLSKNDVFLQEAHMIGLNMYHTSINEQIDIPATLKGKYYLLLLLDPRKVVQESNEKNNVIVFPMTLN